MSSIPPALAWYSRVTEAIALRGWSKAELSERAGVARSTIDGWQRNPRRPQAKSVNAVADTLGIGRAEALRLAGIVGEPRQEPATRLSEETKRQMRDELGDEMAARLIAHAEHLAAGRTAEPEGGRPRGSSGTDRRTAG
jgi:transcriptional regulator with XRE-family HTH domain